MGLILQRVGILEASASANVAYSFTREGELIADPASSGAEHVFWPVIVDMSTVTDFPYQWAIYFSTDHAAGAGGIWLFGADGDPSDPANWIDYDDGLAAGDYAHIATKPAGNPIFQYTATGSQTETPHVVVFGAADVKLYAHNAGLGNAQSTFVATSPNGVQFTYSAILLDYNPATNSNPGDGHTGYFRFVANPFSGLTAAIPGITHVGYSRWGGGDYQQVRDAQWYSTDNGATWTKRTILPMVQGRVMQTERVADGLNYGFSWVSADWSSVRELSDGTYSVVGTLTELATGISGRVLAEFQLNDTGDGILGQPIRLLERSAATAYDDDGIQQPWSVVNGAERVFVYSAYQGSPLASSIGCATTPIPNTDPAFPALDPAIPGTLSESQVDFRSSTPLPAAYSVQAGGTTGATNAGGYRLTIPSSTQGFLQRTGIVPDNFDFIEFWGTGRIVSAGSGGDHRATMGLSRTSGNMFGTDWLLVFTTSALGGKMSIRASDGGVTVEEKTCASLEVGINDSEFLKDHSIGLRWWPAEQKAVAIGIGNGGQKIECSPVISTAGLDTSATWYPVFGYNVTGTSPSPVAEIESLTYTTG